ncbi:MAG TPA: filamentous hemagglutinin N-terminal domain-containing protein, partial [Rhodocyclaceae bacterium]|nr:filamentous hemagglutinin N-terminal domain-containing protein [Rhodocyclaceae bacterium]
MKKNVLKGYQAPRPTAIGLAVAMAFAPAMPVWALPTGEQVVVGNVTVSRPTTGNMLIQQSTGSAIVNWNSFSIGGNEVVRINQPGATSVILNRVTGNDPSSIYGQLSANGKVFLVNPSGVLFGEGARVDVGSLVASTLSIGNADFLAGRYTFSGPGGALVNRGAITAAQQGTVALLGGSVTNEGTITARMGTVAMGSGRQITLDLAGDGLSQLTVSEAALSALVANGGALVADGGQVLLTARAVEALASGVINQRGVARAQTLVERNGRIVLDGGDNGTTIVSGTLDTTGNTSGSKGGEIQVLGRNVGIVGNATLDASGKAGGGNVLIGGDYQGRNVSVRNAEATFIGRDASLRADAIDNGDGGKVIAWGSQVTRAHGMFSAQGGASGGNGGLIETSGKFLDISGARVSAGASKGIAGEWLLDPIDITIQSGAAGASANAGATPNFVSSATPSTITDGDIEAALNSGTSVSITTSNAAAVSEFGSITIAAGTVIDKTAGGDATLTLTAERTIQMDGNASIRSTAGALNVDFNSRGLFQAITASTSIVGGGIVMSSGTSIFTNGGNVRFYGADDPVAGRSRGFSATANLGATTATSVQIPNGIALNGATIDVCVGGASGACGGGTGTISLRGQGAATSTQVSTGAGTVTSADGNPGVLIFNSALRSGAGSISVDGLGSLGGIGTASVGNSSIASQTGNVILVGTGVGVNGASVDDPVGLLIGATSIQTGGGASLAGTGGDVSAQVAAIAGAATPNTVRFPTYGVLIDTSSVTAGLGRTISVSGQAGNNGVSVNGAGVVSTLDARDVQIGFSGAGALNASGGAVIVNGGTFGVQANGSSIDVSRTGGTGGSVQIGGVDVGVFQTTITANGTAGGGLIALDADNVAFVASNATLSANATTSGSGGTIRVRALGSAGPTSASTARVYGTLSATGAGGGNGGTIETSGFALDVNGISVNASSAGGQAGTWVIDPIDVTISDGATVGGTVPDFVAAVPGANVQDTDISNALSTGTNVSISTSGAVGVPEQGNLTMNGNAAIVKSGGGNATLTLNAHNNISIFGSITSTSGALGVDLNSDSDSVNGGAITVAGSSAPISIFSNGGDIRFYGQGGPGTGRANSAPGSGLAGIRVTNAVIDARVGQSAAGVSGNILMRGEGSQLQFLAGSGVSIEAATLAASTGSIELNGLGGTGGDGVRIMAADPDFTGPAPLAGASVIGGAGGVRIWGLAPQEAEGLGPFLNSGVLIGGGSVAVANGVIDIRGRSEGQTWSGVQLTDVGLGGNLPSSVSTSGANGRILVSGEGTVGVPGVEIAAGATVGSAATQAPIVIRAANNGDTDALVLAGTLRGSGVLNLRPGGVSAAPQFNLVDQVATPITISAGNTGFDLATAEIARIQPGFASIVLGSNTHSGSITVDAAASFADPLTLQNDGGAGGVAINAVLNNGARNLTLSSGGAITQAAPITAGGLLVRGVPSSAATLNNAGNAVGTLSVDPPASFSFVNSGALTLGPLSTTGFSAATNLPQTIAAANSASAGNFQVQTLAGNLTLNQNVTTSNAGSSIDLAAANLFVNAGGGDLNPGAGGVWRVWANSWIGETRGGLAPGNTLPNLYGCTFGDSANCGGSGVTITPANHFLYSQRPDLLLDVNDIVRTYGSPNPPLTPVAPAGLLTALGDTLADAATGGFSTVATQTSPVGVYAITGAFTSPAGYILEVSGGSVTVNPAVLTYTADPSTRDQGQPNPVFSGAVSGFVLGETLATATGGALAFTSPTDATTAPGSHPINGSGLTAGNYTFVQAPSNATALTILPVGNPPP